MRTSELIEELQDSLNLNGDIPVMTSSNYGDISRTEQLNYIDTVQPCYPIETAYSESGLAWPDDEGEDDRYPTQTDKQLILILRH